MDGHFPHLCRAIALALAVAAALSAQLVTGRLEGTIYAPDGRPQPAVELTVTGAAGFEIKIKTDDSGRFSLVLPYGMYRVSDMPVRVEPLGTAHADLVLNPMAGTLSIHVPRRAINPEPLSVQGSLLSLDPATVSDPLDFTGLADNRLSLLSVQGYTWTATEFRLQGMNATDSYQPGRPVALPDAQALETTVARSAFALEKSRSYGDEAGVYLAQPEAGWHGAVQSDGTGRLLGAAGEHYNWMARDHAEIGGTFAGRAELFASGTGQWSSEEHALWYNAPAQRSRMLYGNIRGRVRVAARDFLDALYSGSRIDLSNGGMPAGFEALAGRRMSPEFSLPGGFANQAEVDHLDFVQAGWTHAFGTPRWGALEARYQYAVVHLDTREASAGVPDQSRVELAGDIVAGAPPLGNFAIRTRHQWEGAWQSGAWHAAGIAHRLTVGGGWNTAEPRNRLSAPDNLNLITADGAPAYVVALNTPVDARVRLTDGSVYLNDHLEVRAGLSADVSLIGDFSRGGPIAWNSAAPRAGFAWQIPRAHGLVLQGGWFRILSPLAGRYLDFGNPSALGGLIYQWIDRNGDGWFEPGEQGTLIARFGGPYSSIDPALRRPYADEIHVGAEMALGHVAVAAVRLFRRDEKQRIAAVNTGVPPSAFTPNHCGPRPGRHSRDLR